MKYPRCFLNLLAGFTLAILAIALAATAAENTDDGWTDLLAGDSLEAWTYENRRPAGEPWVVEDGVLHREGGRGGSLITKKDYQDFELQFEWKVDDDSNSGIKYRVYRTPYRRGYRWIGPEYQICDEDGRWGGNRKTATASLYDLKPVAEERTLHPMGEWNRGRIVARGNHIEHWLNDKKVMEVDLDSAEWLKLLKSSKFRGYEDVEDWFARKPGPIMVQGHTRIVYFRNLRIKELTSESE